MGSGKHIGILLNTSNISCGATISVDVIMYKQDPNVYAIMNGIVSNTIDVFISNGLVEVFHTNITGTLVGSDHDLSILTGYSLAVIDMPNSDTVDY